MSFDLSLARGLDYYTGLIYEAIIVGELFVPLQIATRQQDQVCHAYGFTQLTLTLHIIDIHVVKTHEDCVTARGHFCYITVYQYSGTVITYNIRAELKIRISDI